MEISSLMMSAMTIRQLIWLRSLQNLTRSVNNKTILVDRNYNLIENDSDKP